MNEKKTYRKPNLTPVEELIDEDFTKRLLSEDTSAYAELQRAADGNSFKKALKELEEAEKTGLENLPDASTLFD